MLVMNNSQSVHTLFLGCVCTNLCYTVFQCSTTWSISYFDGVTEVLIQQSFTTACVRKYCVVSHSLFPPLHLLLSNCFDGQGVGTIWRRGYNTAVLRVAPCSLPGMATFVSTNKPNFRVTSTRDPDPLISYHTDAWTAAYDQNSHASLATSHNHEMRASVIMKTSDVTSSWPQLRVSSLHPGHRHDRECRFFFPPLGARGA